MRLLLAAALTAFIAHAEDISFNGNAYATAGTAKHTEGGLALDHQETVASIYFHVDRPCALSLTLKASVPAGESVIRATAGTETFTARLQHKDVTSIPLGSMHANQAGYVRVDVQGIEKTGPLYAELHDLTVTSPTSGLVVSYVKDNASNRYYWGRRGPSVHLSYALPADRSIEWFYNEVTVPTGKDPVGSYFTANGFGEGYFGMQVKSATDRCILFSVWSPFHTDDPKAIPADQRVTLLAKGKGVRIGEFGNEGSGGQSFFNYPWQPGTACRFLNRAKPDGKGATVYTAWFYRPDTQHWQLIASFRRPNTDKHLTGVHSFLENFIDTNGWLAREARYGNQWARDTTGQWHALTTAKFTGDDIARRGYRLDYSGGAESGTFFLSNGGFIAGTTQLGTSFTRPAGDTPPPQIDLEQLEGVSAPP